MRLQIANKSRHQHKLHTSVEQKPSPVVMTHSYNYCALFSLREYRNHLRQIRIWSLSCCHSCSSRVWAMRQLISTSTMSSASHPTIRWRLRAIDQRTKWAAVTRVASCNWLLFRYSNVCLLFQTPLTEDHIVKSLSSKKDTLTIMLMTKLFSLQMTNAITDFEVQFAYDSTTLDSLKQWALKISSRDALANWDEYPFR